MINGRTVLAIIPARGGSKRLPGKNLKPLCGKPMIQWTIGEAKKALNVDDIVVSTEDPMIAGWARSESVDVVERPVGLAEDHSSIYDVVFHTLDQVGHFDYVCLLQPTSPLRIVADIDDCITCCAVNNAPSCISITEGRPDANGAVYCAWTSWLRETRLFDSGRVVAHAMPLERSIDVDTMDDFKEAERLMSLRLSGVSSEAPPSYTRPPIPEH